MAELALSVPKVECIESNETYGRFVAEPLERGFAITLGNCLRRVLNRLFDRRCRCLRGN